MGSLFSYFPTLPCYIYWPLPWKPMAGRKTQWPQSRWEQHIGFSWPMFMLASVIYLFRVQSLTNCLHSLKFYLECMTIHRGLVVLPQLQIADTLARVDLAVPYMNLRGPIHEFNWPQQASLIPWRPPLLFATCSFRTSGPGVFSTSPQYPPLHLTVWDPLHFN